MALTRHFTERVQVRAQAPVSAALLVEAITGVLSSEIGAGKALLRDYVNTAIGFDQLSAAVARPVKSSQRMPGPYGSPTSENLVAILKVLQELEAVQIPVKLDKNAA